jgi:predicted GIY-YIG superfamily endonuclease
MYRVYKISCSVNGKIYIGYTGKTAEERFKAHLLNARWRKKTALYDAIRAYGNDSFSVELLVECETHAQACAEEIKFIAELNSMLPNGYNMTRGGDGVPVPIEVHIEAGRRKRGIVTEKMRAHFNSRRGIKHSPEHIAKVAAKRLGSKRSEETRCKMSEAQKGRVNSEEARQKLSKALKGRPWTQAQRDARQIGKKCSEEIRRKMSEAKKGRPWTQAQRDARIKPKVALDAQRVEKVS